MKAEHFIFYFNHRSEISDKRQKSRHGTSHSMFNDTFLDNIKNLKIFVTKCALDASSSLLDR